ncbi:hypothetical protein R3P38DRAFT_3288689 [Favolaschia claudopus]|uniref:Uncharacterized protein n=1 Tax=Favolaschia claudopus TaxID=2862362 RepID=A0AAV9ZVY8_9AGAR
MESRRNPLEIPELVDHCVSLLSGQGKLSRLDLLSSCLVARSWVQPSQYYLFHSPEDLSIRGSTSMSQLFDTLIENPHLIRYVRSLIISSTTVLDKMCRIPFTHLQRIAIHTDFEGLEQWEGEAQLQLQQIFSISGLRVLDLCGDFSFFHPCFKNLSPTIHHLSLTCDPWTEEDLGVPQASLSGLSLKSLDLCVSSDEECEIQLQSLDNALFYPFDISNLEALSVSQPFSIHWDSISKLAKQSLRVLNIFFDLPTPVDLSSFPNLTTLRLNNLTKPSCFSATLSSVPSPRTIRTIILGRSSFFEGSKATPLDSLLSSFECSFPPMIECETPYSSAKEHDELRSQFPILVSQNRFRVTYHSDHSNWWEEMVDRM